MLAGLLRSQHFVGRGVDRRNGRGIRHLRSVPPVDEMVPMTAPDPDLLHPIDSTQRCEFEGAAQDIEETRNYGLTVLRSLHEAGAHAIAPNEAVPIIVAATQLRWALELISAIEQQIRTGWADAAAVTVRSLFESVPAMQFMLRDESKRARRAFAYTHCSLHEVRGFLLERTPGTKEEGRLAAAYRDDNDGDAMLVGLGPERVAADLRFINERLARDGMRECELERERMRIKNPKRPFFPKWYSYFDGPGTLNQLAVETGNAGKYHTMYSHWSRAVHGTDTVAGTISVSDGNAKLRKLRTPSDLDTPRVFTISFALDLYEAVMWILPASEEERYRSWRPCIRLSKTGSAAGSVVSGESTSA